MKIMTLMLSAMAAAAVLASLGNAAPREAVNKYSAAVSLRETIRTTAIFDIKGASVPIRGTVKGAGSMTVRLRVTDSFGRSSEAAVAAKGGSFTCRYPSDFKSARLDSACMLFVDASIDGSFDVSKPGHQQAEAALLVCDRRHKLMPDMPNWFTDDLRDGAGHSDASFKQWPAARTLINLYMHSYAARIAGVGRSDFDLAKPADLSWFKKDLTLYEFGNRDRDWSRPMNHRVARTFWQSVWDNWFNSSNDHPLDGNKGNTDPSNYMAYAFSNDYSDTLISYAMRLDGVKPVKDNLKQMCREGASNLLAMQHKEPTNFALVDHRGKQEKYTAGAFRYGMFENGDFMSEGNGWFYNPAFLDYIAGGVLNGRCVWAMGEALKADPKNPQADALKKAIALAIRFCLNDALDYGYAHKTKNGNVYWRDAGEHAYLVIGMLAACSVDPDMPVPSTGGEVSLRKACVSALNALVDLEQPHDQWAVYPNVDSMAIAALADGALLLRDQPDAKSWREVASRVADGWLNAKVDPKEFTGKPVNFGLRITPDTMTYNWTRLSPDAFGSRNFIFFYQTGHWMHALSRLYALTGDVRYRQRAESMLSYLLGDNPWGVRLLNEIGGVYNWVEDRDGDGIEENLKQDMYPESTDFCQIGIMHLMRDCRLQTADRSSGK